MLSQRWNPFRVCSASDKIRSAYAQCAMKFVPRMLSMDLHVKTVHILPLAEHARKFVPRMLSVRRNRFLVCSACTCYNFRKLLKNPKKCKLGAHLIGPKWTLKKNFWDISPKKLVPRMLSHRENVRTSKFWRKSNEEKRNFFRKFTKGI